MKPRSGGLEVAGSYFVETRLVRVLRAKVGRAFGINGGIGLIDAERHRAGVSRKFHARQMRHGLQRALFEHAALVFVVAGQAHVIADDRRAIGPESERRLE